jgi:AGCS family alanine or glycine:cation symporter
VKYRVKDKDGHTYGGPMYALERGLNMKWLAVLFAVFTALASFGIGCTVQANSIALLAYETFGIPTWLIGLMVCLLTAAVILGGVKAIARVCTILVPFMAALYVLGCIAILFMNSMECFRKSTFVGFCYLKGFILTSIIYYKDF